MQILTRDDFTDTLILILELEAIQFKQFHCK
jgi:hypothetical protein